MCSLALSARGQLGAIRATRVVGERPERVFHLRTLSSLCGLILDEPVKPKGKYVVCLAIHEIKQVFTYHKVRNS